MTTGLEVLKQQKEEYFGHEDFYSVVVALPGIEQEPSQDNLADRSRAAVSRFEAALNSLTEVLQN